MEFTISNVEIMQADGTCLPRRDVLIKGDAIAAITPTRKFPDKQTATVIDGSNRLMVPGFVNAHLHSHDRFDKGRLDNLPLELWMAAYNPALGHRPWTPEDCYLRTTLNCLELIKSGVTTVVDDCVHTDLNDEACIDAVFRAYEDAGIRAVVTIAYSDLPWYETIPFLAEFLPKEIKQETNPTFKPEHVLSLWRSFAGRWRGRVSFGVSPSGVQRCSADFLKKAVLLARELVVPAYIHTLESKVQHLTGYLFYGKSLVEYLQELGLLGPESNLVHCVWINDKDVDIIARNSARVIHNPISNLRLGSGIAPIAKLVADSVPVGLGTDNNGCNDSANLMEAMKLAALIGKITTANYADWIGAKEALAMATTGGAACTLNSQIGEIKVGGKADFSLFNLKSLSFFPAHNRLYQLIYAESGQSLETLVVDGRIILKDRQIITINEENIKNRLLQRQAHILELITDASKRSGELLPYLKLAYDRCHQLAGVSTVEKPPVFT